MSCHVWDFVLDGRDEIRKSTANDLLVYFAALDFDWEVGFER